VVRQEGEKAGRGRDVADSALDGGVVPDEVEAQSAVGDRELLRLEGERQPGEIQLLGVPWSS
jgi:hypothetical protein